MRTLVALLFALPLTAAPCGEAMRIPLAPPHVEGQCEYFQGAIASAGDAVFGAWMTSRTGGFGTPITTGSTAGGVLDGRGHLVAGIQQRLNSLPAIPSVATNGTVWVLASTRSGVTTVQSSQWPEHVLVAANSTGVPRTVWDGRDFLVLTTESASVVAYRLDGSGNATDRVELANGTTLGDATRAGDGRTLVVTPRESVLLDGVTVVARHTLDGIPADAKIAVAANGDAFLVAWHAGVVGATQLDASGAATHTITLQPAAGDEHRIDVAAQGDGFVVLWNEGRLLRGARVHDATTRSIPATDGLLLGATSTSAGVLALVSRGCGHVDSMLLEFDALAPVEIVSRTPVPQVPHALAAIPNGNVVLWSESIPAEQSSRLYASLITSGGASTRTLLTMQPGWIFDAVLDWPVAAWAESRNGEAIVRAARLADDGTLLWRTDIATAGFFVSYAVSGNDVYTAERAVGEYYSNVYRTHLSGDGAVVSRTLVAARVDPLTMRAAPGIVTWFESLPDDVRLFAFDDNTHVLPIPLPDAYTFALQDAVTVNEPVVLWSERAQETDVHAWFPARGADVIAYENAGGLAFAVAEARANGTFDVGVVRSSDAETFVDVVNVTPSGIAEPRDTVCFAHLNIGQLALRDGRFDALTAMDGNLLTLVRRRPVRRRALH